MRMHRQGRTDRRTTGRGEEEEEAESEGREEEQRGKGDEQRAKGRAATMSATTGRAEECRTEIQANAKRFFKLPTAPKTMARPRASVFVNLSFGVVVYLYMAVVAVSQVLAGKGGCWAIVFSCCFMRKACLS